ncbi:hypothetical protein MMC18_006863 [Xylographa bjoerkii]|nr:hypothetical protein [Xylographa bjoerkii]
MADEIIEECLGVVENSAMPSADLTYDQLITPPTGSTLRSHGSSSSEDYTMNILSNSNHKIDANDSFQQYTPWSSNPLADIVRTDGPMPQRPVLSYDCNGNTDSFTTAGTGQVENKDPCIHLEHQMSPAWPSLEVFHGVNHFGLQENTQPMDLTSDGSFEIPAEREVLASGDISRCRYPNFDLIECQDPSFVVNNQFYDTAFGAPLLDAFANYDPSPFGNPSRLDYPHRLFDGSYQTDGTVPVSYVGSNCLESPQANVQEQHHPNDNWFISQPGMPYNLPARIPTCTQIFSNDATNTAMMPTEHTQNPYATPAIGETSYKEESFGENSHSSILGSNVSLFATAASPTVDNLLWTTSNPTIATTLTLNCEKTQKRIEHGAHDICHGRDLANIAQTDTDVAASTAQNYPDILSMGTSKQHDKSAFWQTTRAPVLGPKVDSNGIVFTRRDIAMTADENSTRLFHNHQRESTHLFREHTHRVSKSVRNILQNDSRGLVRRKFQKHERAKVAKVREVGSCMLCRQQKAPVSTLTLCFGILLKSS